MGCLRFLTDNYSDPDRVANFLGSSQQTPTFPTANVLAERRSKVWRTNGYYDLRTIDTTIVFRETTGVDLTATITPAEYMSTTSLMTAIKTALEAAGASTYTVTQVMSFKFQIVSNGLGGGGIFQLRWDDPASADMANALGFDTTPQTGGLTYVSDVLRLHTSEWLLLDFGISSKPSDFAMVTRRNSSLPISPNAVIKLQGNHTNNFSSPVFEQSIPYDDEIFLILADTEIYSAQALRYWRVYFEDKENPNGYLELGYVFLGKHFSPDQGAAQFPFTQSPIDRSTTVYSEGGASFSGKKEKTTEFIFDWKALSTLEKEAFLDIWEVYGTSQAFFMAFDPNSAFSSSANRMTKLVKYADEPKPTLVSPNIWNMTTKFREEI